MSRAIRRIPVLGWVGVALLAFSFGLVIWVSGHGVHAAEDGTSAPAKATKVDAVACYAYGDLESGVSKLYPVQLGRVVKVLAHDNEVVDKDAPLLQMDDTTAKADLARAQVALHVAENDLQEAKFLPKQHAAKIDAQAAAVAAKKFLLEAAQAKRDQAKRLSTAGGLGVSKEDYDAAEATVHAAEEAVKIEEKALEAIKDYDPGIKVKSAEQQVAEKKELIKKAEFALRECTLRAPEKGTVLRVTVAEGDTLGPNPREPAVVFCPDRPRILRAEIEQEFANRLFLGQTAVVRDDSTNSTQYYGKVTRISDWFSHRRSMIQEPLQFNDVRTLECIIMIDAGQKMPLRIGQRVRVTLEAGN